MWKISRQLSRGPESIFFPWLFIRYLLIFMNTRSFGIYFSLFFFKDGLRLWLDIEI